MTAHGRGAPRDVGLGLPPFGILPDLLRGLVVTVEATVLGSIVAFSVGLAPRSRGGREASAPRPAGAFVEFVRSTPLLVQLYFLFYVFPEFGVTLSPLAAGVLGPGSTTAPTPRRSTGPASRACPLDSGRQPPP